MVTQHICAIALPPLHALGRLAFKRWLEKPIVEGLAARTIFDSQLWQLSIHEVNQDD
ncbi:MAG: hypothetical protein V7L01_13795 [Nostoc sp.]|uniref:hypothetical protein n=1 Tax=Nostoc sp. TaxID=1180 RepID=UPI002FF8D7E3